MNARSWTIGQQVAAVLVVPIGMLVLLATISFHSASELVGIGSAIVLSVVVAATIARNTGRRIGSAIQHMQSSAAELQAAATQQATGSREQAIASDEVSTT